MLSIRNSICLCLIVAVAACVEPEAPPAPRMKASEVAKPTMSTAGYEDAPLPNRKVGTPTGDSIIKVAH